MLIILFLAYDENNNSFGTKLSTRHSICAWLTKENGSLIIICRICLSLLSLDELNYLRVLNYRHLHEIELESFMSPSLSIMCLNVINTRVNTTNEFNLTSGECRTFPGPDRSLLQSCSIIVVYSRNIFPIMRLVRVTNWIYSNGMRRSRLRRLYTYRPSKT